MLRQFENQLGEKNGLVNGVSWSAFLLGADTPVVLLAVSGGVDSMVMADLFLKTFGPGSFAVAHCNFHLRGNESDGDEELVRKWAESAGVRFHKADFDTEHYAESMNQSIEMAAREVRYKWFASLCFDNGYVATSVAHNANDNAETLILNLLRGTGLEGLKGMMPVSDFPLPGVEGLKLLRPLVSFTRKQIEGYAFAQGVSYRNDSTNFESDYKRNRIRNEVFPHFHKINPSFVRTLNQDMSYFSDASDIVRTWCESASENVVSPLGDSSCDGLKIDIESLKASGHWKYLLYHILSPYGFNSSVLASLEGLLMSRRTLPGKRFESDRYVLMTGRGELTVFSKDDMNRFIPDNEVVMPVRDEGVYHFNGRVFKVEVLEWSNDMPRVQPAGVVVFDAEKLKFPFVLRRWRSGDWMKPLGLKGRKLLSDMFADLKYDAASKASAVVVVDVQSEAMAAEQHVISLAGVRIDEGYKITASTKSVIRISCQDRLR